MLSSTTSTYSPSVQSGSAGVPVAEEASMVMVKVRVPQEVRPGQPFSFDIAGKTFKVTCPPNVTGGEEMYTYVPLKGELASVGKSVLRDALEAGDSVRAALVKDHSVDESAPSNQEHGIVSGRKDDIVDILEGTLEKGLPTPYSEYCLVKFVASGKVGKVSRFLLRPLPADGK
jgi:hypothetical protein